MHKGEVSYMSIRGLVFDITSSVCIVLTESRQVAVGLLRSFAEALMRTCQVIKLVMTLFQPTIFLLCGTASCINCPSSIGGSSAAGTFQRDSVLRSSPKCRHQKCLFPLWD
ncbi:unnamed protein product [Urochloa humidicola]